MSAVRIRRKWKDTEAAFKSARTRSTWLKAMCQLMVEPKYAKLSGEKWVVDNDTAILKMSFSDREIESLPSEVRVWVESLKNRCSESRKPVISQYAFYGKSEATANLYIVISVENVQTGGGHNIFPTYEEVVLLRLAECY